MKNQMHGILIAMFVALMSGLTGCGSLWVGEPMYSRSQKSSDINLKPILSDEIVAIGRPDATMAKAIEQSNAIAFVGKKHTYLLHKGGEELEKISRLNLDSKRMYVDANGEDSVDRRIWLHQKDQQIWGELVLIYEGEATASSEEQANLKQGGFTSKYAGSKYAGSNIYQRIIGIEGVIYPAIKLSDEQLSKLSTPRPFNLYPPSGSFPRDSIPVKLNKICGATLLALGAGVIDGGIFSAPVGIIGGTSVLVIGINSVANGTWSDEGCW